MPRPSHPPGFHLPNNARCSELELTSENMNAFRHLPTQDSTTPINADTHPRLEWHLGSDEAKICEAPHYAIFSILLQHPPS